jgi:hypothetical protein
MLSIQNIKKSQQFQNCTKKLLRQLKMRRMRSFETSGTNHPLTQFNVSEEQNYTGLQRKPKNKQANNQPTVPFV